MASHEYLEFHFRTEFMNDFFQIYNDGVRNINLNLIIRALAAPCIERLGLALAVPYVISQSIVPIFGKAENFWSRKYD